MVNIFMKTGKRRVSLLLILMLLFSLITFNVAEVHAISENLAYIAAGNNYRAYEKGIEVGNGWSNITAYDVYILEKEGTDTSRWERNSTNLKAETIALINDNINSANAGIKFIAQSYLAAKEFGEAAKAGILLGKLFNQQNKLTGAFESSDIYSTMPVYDMLAGIDDLDELDVEACKTYVLEEQNVEVAEDNELYGAWGAAQWYQIGEDWFLGEWGPDFISSAEAVRVLNCLYTIAPTVEIYNRINIGLNWLLNQQQADGSFLYGSWDDPVTNTAEMIITLDRLGERGSDAWNKAVDYLENNALNSDGGFGGGGIGNNTLLIEAYRIINGASIPANTIIDIDIISDNEAVPIGLTKQYNVQAYRFGLGKELLDNNVINWSTTNSDIATATGGLLKLFADEEVKIIARYNGFEDEKNISRTGNFSVNAVTNNYRAYQEGTEVGNGWSSITAYDVYILESEGSDTSRWERNSTNLKEETIVLINDNINSTSAGIKFIAQSYLAAKEFGQRTSAAILLETMKNQQNTTTGAFESSDIYSTMPVYDMLASADDLDELDVEACKTYVLEEQNVEVAEDNELYGAWGAAQWYQVGEDWFLGEWGPDFKSSAEAARVLDCLYKIAPTVEIYNRINIGLNWLLNQQKADGSFLYGSWDDPVTNTAEMIITLDRLGERGSDEWNKAVDYLENNVLNSGGGFGGGGIGNNTLILIANNIINGEQLADGTVIELILSPPSIELLVNESFECGAQVYRLGSGISNINEDLVSWTITSNGNVAGIDRNGVVTANANGTAIVTGEFNNIEKQIEVTVEGGDSGAVIQPDYINITIFVTGIDDEILYSGILNLRKDEDAITALDALSMTGLNYKFKGSYVSEIDGLKEKTRGALSGWKYKVNNKIPSQSADNYYLKSNDVVIWYFAENPSDEGPTLGSLINQNEKEKPKQSNINVSAARSEDEKALSDAINNNGEAVIAVKEGRNGAVYLSGDTLFSLAEKAIPLTVKNGDTLVSIANNSIARELLEKAKGSNKGSVELKVDKLSKESQKDFFQRVDEDIMKGFTDVGGDIFEIGARIVYTDSEGIIENEDKIAAFFEPLKVTMPVPANISEEEAKKLTAIRYERDENGNIIPVKIGGKYDPVTKTITFYAEKGGSYGIMKAENLTRLNLQIDEQSVVIDDEEKSIDVPPMIINSRTMVPVRFISEALNAQVDWIPETRKVIITMNNEVIELTIGEIPDGMDTPPIIMNNRTLVPVRYISEKLGANVLWIPSSRTVQIVN